MRRSCTGTRACNLCFAYIERRFGEGKNTNNLKGKKRIGEET
jgi:hypothetical protein